MQVPRSKRLLCVAATVGLIGVRLDTGWYWTDPDWTRVGTGSIAHPWKCYIITLLQVARGPNIFNLRGLD